MTQQDRRVSLIRALLSEVPRGGEMEIPPDEARQKQLLRALMNVRAPLPAPAGFLPVQDAYLSEEIKRRGIVDGSALPPARPGSRLFLWQGDITRLKVDAIVNAANSALLGCFQPCHTCIDNAIHTFSGIQLRFACNEIMRAQGHEEAAGSAKITAGYNLPCKYVLHTVGPVVSGRLKARDCALLENCYQSCLALAVKNNLQSIAFCCISTGVFGFPQEEAAEIAVRSVSRFLAQDQSLRQVVFNVFTDKDLAIYQKLFGCGQNYSPPQADIER